MRILLATVAVGLAWANPALPQGTWFDIGSGRPAFVACSDDTSSWMEFSAYPFGESWPLGTLVYAELARESDPDLAVVYTLRFSDGGCGCGTDLLKPIAFRFHYDDTSILWSESSTTLFVRRGDAWVKEPNAILDEDANAFSGFYWGVLVGTPSFGIGRSDALQQRAASWGRVKSIYGPGK